MSLEINCPRCESADIIKDGKVRRAIGKVQRYICKNCNKLFNAE